MSIPSKYISTHTFMDSVESYHDKCIEFVYSYMVVWFQPFFVWLIQWFGFNPDPSPVLVVPAQTTQFISESFVAPFQKKFLSTYSCAEEDKGNSKYNQSIDPVFYSLDDFKEILENETNELERLWKTKILMKSTPRGNVIMFYDVYKQGFSYYTDTSHVPYDILNALAMEYVCMFRCRDFFMDENILPEDTPSRLITLQELEEKKEKDRKQSEHLGIDKQLLKDAPFAKFKNYKTETAPVPSDADKTVGSSTEKEKERVKEKKQNRFVYLGKMANFSFIQKPLTKTRTNGFTSSLLSKPHTSYAEYKRNIKQSLDSAVNTLEEHVSTIIQPSHKRVSVSFSTQ